VDQLTIAQMWLRRMALFIGILLSGGNFILPRIPMLILLILLCVLSRGPLLGFRRQMTSILAILIFVLVAALAAGGIEFESLATRYANFIGAMALLGLYGGLPRETLAIDLDMVLKWMVPQAILTVIVGELFGQFFTPIVVNETIYQTFLFVFTYHVMMEQGSLFLRPDGFFFEPGVYQIYLNIYLFLCLFVFRRFSHAVAAVVAILVLQSTTGLAICMAQLGAAYLVHLRRIEISKTLMVALFGLAALIPVGLFSYDNFQTKTSGVLRGSAWARQYDLITGARVAMTNPIVGIGFNYERYYEEASRVAYRETKLASTTIATRSNSNGIVTVLYSMGIPLGLLFLTGLFFQPFLPMRWLVGSMLLVSLMSESLMLTPFFLLFTFGGFMQIFGGVTASRSRTILTRPHPL
jgi:hypothetical protein